MAMSLRTAEKDESEGRLRGNAVGKDRLGALPLGVDRAGHMFIEVHACLPFLVAC